MNMMASKDRIRLTGIIITITIITIKPDSNIIFAEANQAVVTNKMRYSTGSSPMDSHSLEQMFEIGASKSISFSPIKNNYRINRDSNNKVDSSKPNHELLDEEDRYLLAKFYQETKKRDPFLSINGGSLSSEALWADENLDGLNALLDFDSSKKTKTSPFHGQRERPLSISGNLDIDHDDDQPPPDSWNSDQNHEAPFETPTSSTVVDNGNQQHPYLDTKLKPSTAQSLHANYSPVLRLLTSYDPIDEASVPSAGGPLNQGSVKEARQFLKDSNNRIVGATVYSRNKNKPPSVSSKSALEAIRLHDDLLKEPPRDGKTRVRMYYHRAIHDDKRLYGNGPWKYWGHGWGVEFGFDPKSAASDNFYQKGYTIERAFGRDFCRDKINCRKSDPNFFKDPQNVGSYSRQHMQPNFVEQKNANLNKIINLS